MVSNPPVQTLDMIRTFEAIRSWCSITPLQSHLAVLPFRCPDTLNGVHQILDHCTSTRQGLVWSLLISVLITMS